MDGWRAHRGFKSRGTPIVPTREGDVVALRIESRRSDLTSALDRDRFSLTGSGGRWTGRTCFVQVQMPIAMRFPQEDVPTSLREIKAQPVFMRMTSDSQQDAEASASPTDVSTVQQSLVPEPVDLTQARQSIALPAERFPVVARLEKQKYASVETPRESRMRLELDHIRPVCLGGKSSAANLRLRCRVHNQYEAIHLFGEEFMERKRGKRG